MKVVNTLYRIGAYLFHRLASWNTGGEGIHSPNLFYLVRMIIYDDNQYYVWQQIEQRRAAMLHSSEILDVVDYGTGVSGVYKVSDIAKNSLQKRRHAQMLFRIVTWLKRELDKPLFILELGTSLGITTAYLAAPDKHNRVMTMEGSKSIADMARKNWNILGLNNIDLVLGNIDNTLQTVVNDKRQIDILYLDANHQCRSVLEYFDMLLPLAHDKSVWCIDDIHHSPDMEKAWDIIKHNAKVTTTMDFFDMGLVFFDPHYLKRNYRLRV